MLKKGNIFSFWPFLFIVLSQLNDPNCNFLSNPSNLPSWNRQKSHPTSQPAFGLRKCQPAFARFDNNFTLDLANPTHTHPRSVIMTEVMVGSLQDNTLQSIRDWLNRWQIWSRPIGLDHVWGHLSCYKIDSDCRCIGGREQHYWLGFSWWLHMWKSPKKDREQREEKGQRRRKRTRKERDMMLFGCDGM